MNLVQYFEAAEHKLRAELNAVRASLAHSGNKGARVENVFRKFLDAHIPRRYEVGHGEVLDKSGANAGAQEGPGQIDVLIIDDAHPRFADISEPTFYFIEGVLAGAEIKASLKLSDAEEIIKKAAEFKRLWTLLGPGDLSFHTEADRERFLNRRPYFLFAFESETPLDSFLQRVSELEQAMGLAPIAHLDAIFLLDRGALINLGDGQGSLASFNNDGTKLAGWLKSSRPVLISLISWLNVVMPSIVHMSPIILGYIIRTKKEIEQELRLHPPAI